MKIAPYKSVSNGRTTVKITKVMGPFVSSIYVWVSLFLEETPTSLNPTTLNPEP